MNRRFRLHAALSAGALLLGSLIARAYDTSWIASGQAISAAKLKADLDEAQARIAALESPMRSAFAANHTTGQMITSGTDPVILFDTELFDEANEHDPTTGVFTPKAAGTYDIGCNLIFYRTPSGSAACYFEAGIFINDVRTDVAGSNGDGYVAAYRARTLRKLAAGDKVTCRGYQNCGAIVPLVPTRSGEAVSSFTAYRLAP